MEQFVYQRFTCRKVFPNLGHKCFLCTGVAAQKGSIVDQQIDFLVDKHSKNTAIPLCKESKASEVSKVKQRLERERD